MEHLLELIVFTCTAAVASSSAATKTSCFAQPAYLGGRGSLTCYFPVDITAEKFSFNVRRAGRHDFDYKRDTVLDCDWIEGEQVCVTIKDGFTYDYHVSSRLTMIIPNVTLDHQGLYTCQVFKEATGNIQSCSLTVSKRESSTRPTIDGIIFVTAQTTLPTTLETPLEEKQVQTADLNIAAIVVPIVIGAVVVVAIVIVVYVVKRRRDAYGFGDKGTGAAKKGPLKRRNAMKKRDAYKLREVLNKRINAWRDPKEKMNTINLQESDEKMNMIHESQETYNGSEPRDVDNHERNNDENEHSKPRTSRDDKGMEDEEGSGATKNALKGMYDPVVKELEQNNEKGVDNLREVPNKRISACRDPKEKMNTINLQEPEEKLNVIHEET